MLMTLPPSPSASIFTAFPVRVDPANLVGWADYPDSLTDASPTVVLDMETGMRVAHFAEVDANADSSLDDQALYIRPAYRLRPAARYAVAIRKTLKAEDGATETVEVYQDGADGEWFAKSNYTREYVKLLKSSTSALAEDVESIIGG